MFRKPSNRLITHISIPILLIVLIFIFTILFVVIPVIEGNMMSSKKAMIKELTNISWDLLEDYHNREINNELSKEEAQGKVIARIRELRYGSKSKGYFWVSDLHSKLIMHPYLSHLEDQDVSDFIDPKGKHLFAEFVTVVKKNGDGYVDYVWQQIDDSTQIASNLSYVKVFEPWGWIIGTGVYIEDVKQQMFGIKKKFNIIFLGIFILFVIVSVYLIIHSRKIEISKKSAQVALSQSENRYHILFNSAADAIFLTKGAVIVDVNKKALEMFGCTREEIIGFTPINFSPATQPNGERSKVLAMEKINLALNGNPQIFEWQHKKLNGTLFETEINLHLIYLPTGNHIQAIIRDITDRKKAEKIQVALSQSENRYHTLFNSAADAIFLTKGDSAEIVDVNQKSLEMFGCRKEEIIEFSPIDFSPAIQPNGEESKVSAMEKISSALKGEPQVFEWQHKKLDGTLFDVEINLHVIELPTGEHIQAIIRDITDRKKAEKAEVALSQSENRYHILFNTAADSIFLTKGNNAEIVDVNRITLEMFGCEKEEIIGFTPMDFSPATQPNGKESKVLAMEKISSALKGEPQLFEWQHKKLDGTLFDVEINLHLIELPTGEHIQAIIRNITDRKKAEQALLNEKNRVANIIEGTNAGTWDWNIQTGEVRLNERWAEIMGYKIKELEPINFKTWKNNVYSEDLQKLDDLLEKNIQGQLDYYDVEYRKLHKNGNLIWVNSRGKVVEWTLDGKPLRMSGTLLDINESKIAEDKLQKSESHYRNIFNNSLIGIYQTTPDGRILAANPALIKMLGFSSMEELLERNLENESENFAIGISRSKFKKQIETEGHIIGVESEWKRKDGTSLYVRENANIVIDKKGKILFYEGTVDDITYKKMAEIEILAANEELLATSDALKESNYELKIALDEAKRSKELEIANEKLQRNEKILIKAHESIKQKKTELEELNFELKKSHDKTTQLNEELSAANEHLFFQKDKLEITIDKLKKTQSQLVQSEKMASVGILTSGIAHEINNPLNFIQGGKLAIENYIEDNLMDRSDDLKPLLDIIETGISRASDIISSLNRFNRKSDTLNEKCEIHVILDNCLIMLQNKLKHKVEIINHYTNFDFVILGNEGKLHQVFLNILSNAEQSIEEEGIIEINTAIENEKLEVKISDNGCGINEEHLSKIIDPFFTTKDPGKGTGLGLSIAYQIIQNHKGTIKINSKLKEGTTVIVTLPIINNET